MRIALALSVLWFVCAVVAKNGTEGLRKMVEIEANKSSIRIGRNESAGWTVEVRRETTRQSKWISQLFVEAAQKFDLHPRVTPSCRRDYELYKMHLANQSVWAVRMMESTQWPTVGIFAGIVDHFGNFDECMLISSHGINGQYCLARATYSIANTTKYPHEYSHDEHAHPDVSAWSAMDWYRVNPVRVDRHKLNWAVCLPSSCKAADLSMSLNNTLQPLFRKHGINISVDVEPKFCHKKEQQTYPLGYYLTIGLYAFLFSLATIATLYEVATRKNMKRGIKESNTGRFLKCFSTINNVKKLVNYSPEKDFVLMHLTKFVNIILVIYGHRFIYFIGFPKFNTEGIEEQYRASSIELIHTNVVDVFFCVSGILTFHFGFLPMLKGGGLYFVLNLFFRWIRLVPVFMLLVLFIINVLPYVGEGPLWNHRVLGEAAQCESSWLSNLLVVNNIISPHKQCLVVSWYISTDIQLTLLGCILLFIITRSKVIGTTITILTFFGALATTFTVAYINNFHGVLLLYFGLLEEPRNSNEFNNFYVAPYTRMGPYLLGFIGAYLIKVLKDKNYEFSTFQKNVIAFGSILIGEGSTFYGCNFYVFGRKYDRFENAIYAALNRTLFVLPYAAVTVVYFVSGLGWVQRLVERSIFVPLGRLTYSVFLVNTIIQLYHASSQRTIMPSSRMNVYWWAISDIFFSYAAGLLLHLLAEAPIANLSKILQKYVVSLFLKKHGGIEKVQKTDSDGKSTNFSSKNSSPELNGSKNFQNGYQNHSFVNSEFVPKISEASRI